MKRQNEYPASCDQSRRYYGRTPAQAKQNARRELFAVPIAVLTILGTIAAMNSSPLWFFAGLAACFIIALWMTQE